MLLQSGPKTAQSLQNYNFAFIRHRVMRFSAKCSKKILHMTKVNVWIKQLNILCFAIGKWTIQKTVLRSTLCSIKTSHFNFFE